MGLDDSTRRHLDIDNMKTSSDGTRFIDIRLLSLYIQVPQNVARKPIGMLV